MSIEGFVPEFLSPVEFFLGSLSERATNGDIRSLSVRNRLMCTGNEDRLKDCAVVSTDLDCFCRGVGILCPIPGNSLFFLVLINLLYVHSTLKDMWKMLHVRLETFGWLMGGYPPNWAEWRCV